MKVRNQTVWRTDHLKAILQRAAEQELEPAKRKVLIVTVSYTRGGASSGCAFVRGRHATVRIRHPRSRSRWRVMNLETPEQRRELALRFASVAVHEFAHIRGMHHDNMPDKYKWHGRWEEYVAWAADMPIEERPKKVTQKASVDDKLEHVRKQLAKAQTRAKRATTILKKWQRKERYYLRAMAAQKASE